MIAGSIVSKIVEGINVFNPEKPRENFFGDGDAAGRIIEILKA